MEIRPRKISTVECVGAGEEKTGEGRRRGCIAGETARREGRRMDEMWVGSLEKKVNETRWG